MATTTFTESAHPRNADGSFAVKPNREPDDGSCLAAPRQQVDTGFHLDDPDAELMKTARDAVRAKLGELDEDLASEALLQFFEAQQRAQSAGRQFDRPTKYLSSIVNNLIRQRRMGTTRGPDMKAIAAHIEARKVFENENGRMMTAAEEDELSERIIAAQGQERAEQIAAGQTVGLTQKATKGYHRQKDRADLPFSALHGGSMTSDQVAETLMDRAAERDGDELFESRDRLSELDVRRADKTLTTSGGARAVAQKVLDGTASEAAHKALFSPFEDDLHPQTSQVIAEKLAKANSDQARALWRELAVNPGMADRVVEAARMGAAKQHHAGVRVPAQTLRRLAPGAAVACRKEVAAAGGAAAAARKLSRGELTDRQTAALLAPWGGAECRTKDARAISAWLAEQDDDAWNAHLDAVTRPTASAVAGPARRQAADA